MNGNVLYVFCSLEMHVGLVHFVYIHVFVNFTSLCMHTLCLEIVSVVCEAGLLLDRLMHTDITKLNLSVFKSIDSSTLMNCRIFLRPWDKYLGIVEFSEALGLVSQ
jgi:hypothetical protein